MVSGGAVDSNVKVLAALALSKPQPQSRTVRQPTKATMAVLQEQLALPRESNPRPGAR